jgi:hypothetical protein
LLDKKERPDRAPGDHTIARRVRDSDENPVRLVADAAGRTTWNIDDGEEPTLGQSVVTDLRITREIKRDPTAKRRLDAVEEDIRIDIHYAVGVASCLIETSNPSVDENNELRWADCAHRIRREGTGFSGPSHPVELQSNGLRELRAGGSATRSGRCGNIARCSGSRLRIKSRGRILGPMLAAGNLQLPLYENVLSRTLCRLCRHDVRGVLGNSCFPYRGRTERGTSAITRWLAKTDKAQKHRTRDERRNDNEPWFEHTVQEGRRLLELGLENS